MPKQTLILDSSQVSAFYECETMWELSYKENLTLNNNLREDMELGTYGHKLMEIYYTNLGLGMKSDEIIDECRKWHNECLELGDDFWLSKEGRNKVWERWYLYWMKYSRKGSDIDVALGPPIHKINEDFTDSMEPNPLVEKGFSFELLNNSEYLFILEGRVDLLGYLNGTYCFVDHKFQGRKRELYPKSIQFRNYSLALDLPLGIINYVRFAKEIDPKETFRREIIQFPKWERDWWREELITMFKRIAIAQRDGEYAHNYSACPGKYGYRCQFTHICEEHNADTIVNIKNLKYEKKQEWHPW